MDVNTKSVKAAQAALDAHEVTLGIEGGNECQVRHLLVSLHEFCGANQIDFDLVLSEVKEAVTSGEEALAWKKFAADKARRNRANACRVLPGRCR